MYIVWDIIWYTWTIIFLIVGFFIALGRLDDWRDPNHRVGQPYKKTFLEDK